ncbi:UNVERIFIED_CONTAM: hypothetical protein NCL1_20717 [Trichonephila clavipes]
MDYCLTLRMFIFHIFLFFLCYNDLEGVGTIPLPGGKDIALINRHAEDEGFHAFHLDNEEEYVNIRIYVKASEVCNEALAERLIKTFDLTENMSLIFDFKYVYENS